jgi:hypothetical protein
VRTAVAMTPRRGQEPATEARAAHCRGAAERLSARERVRPHRSGEQAAALPAGGHPCRPVGPGRSREGCSETANQVDERRNPRTNATVNQLSDRHFELVTLDRSTLATYIGAEDKHIRPIIGSERVGALDADLFDSFYAELRRCREHCDRRPYVEHRTNQPHDCDERCRQHACTALGDGHDPADSLHPQRRFEARCAVAMDQREPTGQAETPPAPKPNPEPPSPQEAARVLAAACRAPRQGGGCVSLNAPVGHGEAAGSLRVTRQRGRDRRGARLGSIAAGRASPARRYGVWSPVSTPAR